MLLQHLARNSASQQDEPIMDLGFVASEEGASGFKKVNGTRPSRSSGFSNKCCSPIPRKLSAGTGTDALVQLHSVSFGCDDTTKAGEAVFIVRRLLAPAIPGPPIQNTWMLFETESPWTRVFPVHSREKTLAARQLPKVLLAALIQGVRH